MTSFLLALQFLSIIPVKIKTITDKNLAESLVSFPIVGLFFALLLSLAISIFSYLGLTTLTIDILSVVLLVFITGGMHLDGLSDTFDALFSGKNKEEMLMIMRDPHAGAMGISAIVSVLLLKIAFLNSISVPLKSTALAIMCVSSRWSMVESMFLFPYARKSGKARSYIEGMNYKIAGLSCAFTITAVLFIWGMKGIIAVTLVSFFAYCFGKLVRDKLGGITGDTLGAGNELAEIFTLLVFIFIERITLW